MFIEAHIQKCILALLQEPYTGTTGELSQLPETRVVQNDKWQDKLNKASIVVFDDDLEIIEDADENFFVTVLKTSNWEIAVVSIYMEDYLPIEPYLDHLRKIQIKYKETNAITRWGCQRLEHMVLPQQGRTTEVGNC